MKRRLYDMAHLAFAEAVSAFVAREVAPRYEKWEIAGIVDREVWLAAGRAGLLGLSDARRTTVVAVIRTTGSTTVLVEGMRATPGLAIGLHNEVIGPYLTRAGQPRAARSAGCPDSAPGS